MRGITPFQKAEKPSFRCISINVDKILARSWPERSESMILVLITSKGVVIAAAVDPAMLPHNAARWAGRSF